MKIIILQKREKIRETTRFTFIFYLMLRGTAVIIKYMHLIFILYEGDT